jgi:hypothetical protein
MIVHNVQAVPLPEEIDDEYLQEIGEGKQPDNKISRTTLFVEYIKLLEFICSDVLEKLYSSGPDPSKHKGPTPTQYLTDVPNLCTRLDEFLDDLPAHLKVENYSTSAETAMDKCFQRQGRFLRSR